MREPTARCSLDRRWETGMPLPSSFLWLSDRRTRLGSARLGSARLGLARLGSARVSGRGPGGRVGWGWCRGLIQSGDGRRRTQVRWPSPRLASHGASQGDFFELLTNSKRLCGIYSPGVPFFCLTRQEAAEAEEATCAYLIVL